MMKRLLTIVIIVVAINSCKRTGNKSIGVVLPGSEPVGEVAMDTIGTEFVQKGLLQSLEGLADTTFVRLADYSSDFAYDLKYATENNFLKSKVYDCAECYIRAKTAQIETISFWSIFSQTNFQPETLLK